MEQILFLSGLLTGVEWRFEISYSNIGLRKYWRDVRKWLFPIERLYGGPGKKIATEEHITSKKKPNRLCHKKEYRILGGKGETGDGLLDVDSKSQSQFPVQSLHL